MIETVDGLIDALGGTGAVAEWAELDASAVSHWRRLNAIPPSWHFRLFALARERGLNVDTSKVFCVPLKFSEFDKVHAVAAE